MNKKHYSFIKKSVGVETFATRNGQAPYHRNKIYIFFRINS